MIVAVNVQEENWNDDGGAHDPFVIDVEALELIDSDLAEKIRDAVIAKEESISLDSYPEALNDDKIRVTPPCMIDGVLPIWYAE